MHSRCIVYALGFVVLFLCRSSLAVTGVPAVNYPFYSTPASQVPVFALLGLYSNERSIYAIPTQYLNVTYQAWDKWSVVGAQNNTLSASAINESILKYLYNKGFIQGATSLSDYDSNSYDYNYIFQLNRVLNVSSLGFTPASGFEYALILKTQGVVCIRCYNPDSTSNVNSLSSRPSDLFDVFFCFFLVPTYRSGSTFYAGCLGLATDTNNLSAHSYNSVSVTYSATYALYGHFRYDVVNGTFSNFDDDRFGLPFSTRIGERVIYFCRGENGYWSYASGSSYPQVTTVSPIIDTRGFPYPLEENLFLQFSGSSDRLQGLSSDTYYSASLFYNLDSDNGSMKDFNEWYQTKHNLLDPSDDRQNTPEIEPPAEDLPEPEEGETVVDIGKDTVDRYGHYWDEQVGDYFDLEPVQPPTSSPEPPAFNFEQFDVESISRRVRGNLDETGLESSMETVFSPLSSSDTPINLTFTPTVDFSSLGSTLQLSTLDLNPSNVLGMNSRSVSEAAQKFKIFRLFLLVAEILLFGYSCFKLVFNMLSPGNSDSSSQQGEE